MIAKLVIHPNLESRLEEAVKFLKDLGLHKDHSAVLWFEAESKLGVDQAKQIRQFVNLKPYQGNKSAVVIEAAENLTLDAQNALLKTLEEKPDHAEIFLGAPSEDTLLPTITSRCQITYLETNNQSDQTQKFAPDIQVLLTETPEKRFIYIEKLGDREAFLKALVIYFRNELMQEDSSLTKTVIKNYLQDLLKAEEWANQNVNIRAILEYLMLKLPKSSKA